VSTVAAERQELSLYTHKQSWLFFSCPKPVLVTQSDHNTTQHNTTQRNDCVRSNEKPEKRREKERWKTHHVIKGGQFALQNFDISPPPQLLQHRRAHPRFALQKKRLGFNAKSLRSCKRCKSMMCQDRLGTNKERCRRKTNRAVSHHTQRVNDSAGAAGAEIPHSRRACAREIDLGVRSRAHWYLTCSGQH
jgi:hypothetical protein